MGQKLGTHEDLHHRSRDLFSPLPRDQEELVLSDETALKRYRIRRVSYAQIAISTRLRAVSFVIRFETCVLTVLRLM